MRPTPLHGLLVLDKPGGLTSRAALDRAQRWFPRGTKAGHTGTLDPLATGVLVLCLGAATRLTEYVQDMAKTYRAGVRLGARSDTDAAAAMGIKPGFPAKKALANYQRLGGGGVQRAVHLLAEADLDLRGDTDLDPETVMEVLVARLSRLTPARR